MRSSRWSASSIRTARRCPGSPRRRPSPVRSSQLQVTPSRPLPTGVYTVNWRVVSAVDGHVESGAFAFGVGEVPAPGSEVIVELLHTSPWITPWRRRASGCCTWASCCSSGAAATSLLVYGGRLPAGGTTVLRVSAVFGVAGLCLMVWTQRVLVGAPRLLPLFLTREGKLLLALGVALLICVGAVAAADIWPARWSLWLLGAAGAAAMLVHVAAGHAASPSSVWLLNVAVQWVHLTAVGVWVGGLFWLLLGLRGEGPRGARGGRRRVHARGHRHPGDRAGDRAGQSPGRGRVGRRAVRHELRHRAAGQDRPRGGPRGARRPQSLLLGAGDAS